MLLLPTTSVMATVARAFASTMRPKATWGDRNEAEFQIQPARIVVDEARRVKGRNTTLWRLVRECQQRAAPMYLLALSGTPITAAYRKLRDAREVEWKKNRPLCLGSLRSPVGPSKHAEGGGLLSEDALPGRRHQ